MSFPAPAKNALRTKNRLQELTNYKLPFKKPFQAVLNFMLFTIIILVYCWCVELCLPITYNTFCYFFIFPQQENSGHVLDKIILEINWVCAQCKNGCNNFKTPVLHVLFIIYFLIPVRIQRRLKDILSHVNGNRRKPAQGAFERQPQKQDIMKFHWDRNLKPDAENKFKVRTRVWLLLLSSLVLRSED